MKSFVATALIGALTVNVDAKRYSHKSRYSQNAVNVVTDLRNHFEKTFGEGLVGMFNEKGEVTPAHMAKASRRPHGYTAEWTKVGGVTINGATTGSVLYGLSQGFQYTGLAIGGASTTSQSNLVESNCFYSMYGLMESVDQLVYDFDNIIDPAGEALWFNLVVYNPISILNNTSVGYEMCDVYQQIDKLSGLMSGDFALMGDYLATDLVYFLTEEGTTAVTNMTSLISCGASDGLLDQVTGIVGQVGDAVEQGQAINDGDVPEDEAGWDTAVEDGEKNAEGLVDAAKSAADLAEALANCEPNFYKIGIQTGNILSKIMKQKLEEAKLP